MTTSISCSAQEELELSEGSKEAELEFSLNDEEDELPHFAPSTSLLSSTIKTKSKCHSERKMLHVPCKTNVKKTWETLFSLDDKLFETHFIGVLDYAHSIMDKLNQLIVTEEYAKLKTYENELIKLLSEIEFGLV